MKIELLHYHPNNELSKELDGISKDDFLMIASRKLQHYAEMLQLSKANEEPIQTLIRQLLEKAQELECVDEFNEYMRAIESNNADIKLFALPKPISCEPPSHKFPLDVLPDVLRNYIKAVSEAVQVTPEMCFLPAISVLAACTMGKAKVRHHKMQFSNEITLYTLTVAASSARKSPTLRYFDRALYEYQNEYNKKHELEREQRKTERAFYENQKAKILKDKNGNIEAAKEIDAKLLELPIIRPMSMVITDATPESMAISMDKNGGKASILDSEGGVLRTIAGMYSGGKSNIDILLKSYDGDPCSIQRATRDDIFLQRPLMSIGILTQPKIFFEVIRNQDFDGKGLLNRFLFSFPETPTYYNDYAPAIPHEVEQAYSDLIKRLLSMPESDTIIEHSKESKALFSDLHYYIQDSKKGGNIFEFYHEYADKQHTNALKIAAILHLCNSTPSTPITGDEAFAATQISMWLFNEALKAFKCEVAEDPRTQTAYRIINKCLHSKEMYFSRRDIYWSLHLQPDEFDEILKTLIECHWVKPCNGKEISDRGFMFTVNPLIKQYEEKAKKAK